MHIYKILTVLIILLSSIELSAQEERRFVRRGMEHMEKEEFEQAETAFREALRIKPNSFEAGYNLASVLFRQERYEDAIGQLQAIVPYTNDPESLAKLYHNLGNSYLYNQELEQSIESYKKSLRQNPLDDETRYNLIAAKKLRDQQEDEEQDQDDQEEQQEEQQEKQEQDQDEQDQQQQEQQEQQQQETEGISREAAERLLQAVEENEKDIMEKMDRHQESQPIRIEKNW